MRVRFTATATAFSSKTQYAPSMIREVVVCNHDLCTHQRISDVKDGMFNVDFELEPIHPDGVITSTLKFHFFTGDIPVVVAAGFVPMECIVENMRNPDHKASHMMTGNFDTITVNLKFHPCTEPLNVEVPAMQPSALLKTQKAVNLFEVMAGGVQDALNKNMNINLKTGAPMFMNLLTCHNMQDQLTTHIHFQRDVTPTAYDSMRFLESGLTMTAVAEALHAQCLTTDQVLGLPVEGDKYTLFVSAVLQSFTRSAHLCPYVSDLVLDDNLDAAGQVRYQLSESFKLPLREPFNYTKDRVSFLCADDCDGLATWNYHLSQSFKYLHCYHKTEKDKAFVSGNVPEFTSQFLEKFFPSHQFDMTLEEKTALFHVATKIGESISKGLIACHVLLLSAGAPALGDKTSDNIGGHAANLIVNLSNKNNRKDFIMEGTNSIQADMDPRTISIDTPNGKMGMSLVQVANLLTKEIAGRDISECDTRVMMHVDNETSSKFYRTGFCQGGTLLGSINSDKVLEYGVSMQHISDYNVKVLMPVNPNLLNSLAENTKASAFLDLFVDARRMEIHPPMVETKTIIEATSAWSRVKAYATSKEVVGRDFKVCLTSTSYRDPNERHAALLRAEATAAEWNVNPRQQQIGHLTAYEAMDSVFTRLCLWTDNTDSLQAALGAAMANSTRL